MKKVLLAAVILGGSLSFMSCKKDYTCECEILGVKAEETQKLKKKDAEEWCDESNTAAAILGGSCSLK